MSKRLTSREYRERFLGAEKTFSIFTVLIDESGWRRYISPARPTITTPSGEFEVFKAKEEAFLRRGNAAWTLH